MFFGGERSSVELDDFWRLLGSPSLTGRSFRFRGGGDAGMGAGVVVIMAVVVSPAIEAGVGVGVKGVGVGAVPHISTIFLFTAFVF